MKPEKVEVKPERIEEDEIDEDELLA